MMYYDTRAELVIQVPIYVEADSKEEADAMTEKFIKTKKFRDYCKKQITAYEKSDCAFSIYRLNLTAPIETERIIHFKLLSDWPIIERR